ncbi:MAG: lysylphosphatidylglycerol synthase domain-containing protein [Hellea sp.]
MSSSPNIGQQKQNSHKWYNIEHLLSIVERLKASNRLRHIAFLIALAIFAVGLLACFLSAPDIFTQVTLKPFLVVLCLGVPLTLLLNAIELILTGRLIDKKIGFSFAFKMTLFGTAANMLPIPGGAVVRIAALKTKGAELTEGTRATFAVGIIWLGVSLIYSGYWMASYSYALGGLTAFGGVAALLLGSVLGLMRYKKFAVIFQIILLKVLATILVTLRLIFCLLALGSAVSFSAAGTMTAANVIGSAVMIVPAGIGINEGMTAVLAQVAGMSAALGFMAALINRLAGLLALCPITLYLYAKSGAGHADA